MTILKLRDSLLCCCLPALACQEPLAPAGTGTTTETNPATTSLDTPTTDPQDEEPMMTEMSSTSGTTGGGSGSSGPNVDWTTGTSGCGDGVIDDDEECDDGLDGNGDTRFCTSICKLNVCGDGKLFVGWELCDEGAANSDDYGSLCGKQCEPGARCGDTKLQPEFETCDLGQENGGEKGDEQGILCDANCNALQLRVFVTEDSFTGDLDGLFGADLKCQAAAEAAGLAEPERFHAFLSTGKVDAKESFAAVTGARPYVLVTGKKVAESFTSLIEMGPLGEGISATEYGTTLYMKPVATNTAPGGLSYSPDQHCQGWTSAGAAYKARVGLTGLPAGSPDAEVWKDLQWWTGAESWHCDKNILHLYCFEI